MRYLLLIIIAAVMPLMAQQEANIVNYLKQIESGESEKVIKILPELKSKHPNDPSVLFLEAVLTEDGSKAVSLYENIIAKYPQSRYADASLFRIASYYYAIDENVKALQYYNKLKSNYPSSTYIKLADRISVKTSNAKYTIQAGAFSTKSNAELLKKELEASGLTAEIREKNVAGSIFQIVYVGKFTTEDEAKDKLEIINKKFKLNGRVTELNYAK